MFLIQGSWGYDRMIGIGLAFAMRPLLPTDGAGGVDRAALTRSAEFFNAHPYLAGAAVGALSRAEADGVEPAEVARLRGALSGPLGAIGDRLFWAGLLRAVSGLGMLLAVLVAIPVGAVVLLVAYNIPHIAVRVWALDVGYRDGPLVGRALGNPMLRHALDWAPRAGALAVGVALPVVAVFVLERFTLNAAVGALGVAAATAVVVRWLAPSFGGIRLALLAAGITVIGSVLWP
jgi:PTS system mannose-specific IID component